MRGFFFTAHCWDGCVSLGVGTGGQACFGSGPRGRGGALLFQVLLVSEQLLIVSFA